MAPANKIGAILFNYTLANTRGVTFKQYCKLTVPLYAVQRNKTKLDTSIKIFCLYG